MNLKIGSRGSQLALWQAHHIAGLLTAQGHTVADDRAFAAHAAERTCTGRLPDAAPVASGASDGIAAG